LEEEEAGYWGSLGGAHRNRGGEVGGAFEDQGTGSFRQEGGYPIDHVGSYGRGQEPSPEGRSVDVVGDSFEVQEEGGDVYSRPLEGFYLGCQGEAGVGRDEPRQGATLVSVEQVLDLGMADSLTVITRLRILDMVLSRTIMRKGPGES